MTVVEKLVLGIVVVVGGGVTIFQLARPDRKSEGGAPQGACALPAGFHARTRKVTWNPISEPGRCAEASTTLMVDNGTDSDIHLALGEHDVVVKAGERRDLVLLPGRFAADDLDLALAAGKRYVYNPGLAWDYTVERQTYARLDLALGPPHEITTLPPAFVFEVPEVDYLFEPLPTQVTAQADAFTIERKALDHGGRFPGRVAERGGFRVATLAPDHVVVFPPRVTLTAPTASVYLDNSDAKRAMTVKVDDVDIASVAPGGFVRVDFLAGQHHIEASTGGKLAAATIAAGDRERWVWTPAGNREYELGTKTARALPPVIVHADYVFDAPASLPENPDGSVTKTVLRRGAVGDFRRAIAKEIAKLGGTADPDTVDGCALFAARMTRDDLWARAKSDAQDWGCPASAIP